jgi:hypothetical protein
LEQAAAAAAVAEAAPDTLRSPGSPSRPDTSESPEAAVVVAAVVPEAAVEVPPRQSYRPG